MTEGGGERTRFCFKHVNFNIWRNYYVHGCSIQDSKCCVTGKELDIENIIAKLVGNVITYVILGESIDDVELLEGWVGNTLEFFYAFKWSNAGEKIIAHNVFEKMRSTQNVKQLREIINSTTLDDEKVLKDITWMTLCDTYE